MEGARSPSRSRAGGHGCPGGPWRELYARVIALIACPEGNAEISDHAPARPRCGVPSAIEPSLIVSAPVQVYLVNPKIRVEWREPEVARLGKGEMVTIPVEEDGVAMFSVSAGATALRISAEKVGY